MGSSLTRIEWLPGMVLRLCEGVSAQAVLEALAAPGETLKASRKGATRRVGGWIIKECGGDGLLGALKRTLLPWRYRRAWTAASWLTDHGVSIARPLAFAERRRWGMIVSTSYIGEYLDGHVNVEVYVQALVKRAAAPAEIAGVLARLAAAVNALCAAGVYHADLSGKNILTRDGSQFCFIDLDAALRTRFYTTRRRLKNHAQLYDSFCDFLDDSLLTPFIAQMQIACGKSIRNPQSAIRNSELWFAKVRATQRTRRARVEARWEKERRG